MASTPQSGPSGEQPLSLRATLLVFAAGALLFYLLRGFRVEGGDTANIFSPEWSYFWGSKPVYNLRESFTTSLIQCLNWFTHDLKQAFALCDAFFGGLFLAALFRYSRDWRFWLPSVASVNLISFVGHVEFYAPILALFTLYLLLLRRALDDRQVSPVLPATAFIIAYLFHKMMIIFSLPMIGLFWEHDGRRWHLRRNRQAELAIGIMIAGVVLDTAISLYAGLGRGMTVIPCCDTVFELVTPFTHSMAHWVGRHSQTGVFFWYTLGEPLHWRYFLGFLFAAAPVGFWAALVFYPRCRWRPGQPGTDVWHLMACAIGLIWMFFWHPHMGWTDWDLFCVGAVPLNLLAGFWWSRRNAQG